MKRPILTAILLCAVLAASVVYAAVTVTHTGPATYADPQWRSFSLSNKPIDANGAFITGGKYKAVLEVCPSTSDQDAKAPCSIAEWEGTTITSGLQTVITYFITNVWCITHAKYCA
jgi:hypothetical protein